MPSSWPNEARSFESNEDHAALVEEADGEVSFLKKLCMCAILLCAFMFRQHRIRLNGSRNCSASTSLTPLAKQTKSQIKRYASRVFVKFVCIIILTFHV